MSGVGMGSDWDQETMEILRHFASEVEQQEEDDEMVFSGVVALAVVALCVACSWYLCARCCYCCCCCRCCGRKAANDEAGPKTVTVQGQEVRVEHLRQRKELLTAYWLWAVGGLIGLHHFYLERLAHGVMCMWSGNFLIFGWVFDMVLLPSYVSTANRGSSAVALSDRTSCRMATRIPCVSILLTTTGLLAYYQGPAVLKSAGLVDPGRLAAKTAENPFDLLGVWRSAPVHVVEAAYREKAAKLEALRRCDKECQQLKKDLWKARGYIGKKPWRRTVKARRKGKKPRTASDDDYSEWEEWTDYTHHQWEAIISHAKTRAVDVNVEVQKILSEGLSGDSFKKILGYFGLSFLWPFEGREPGSGPAPGPAAGSPEEQAAANEEL